MTPMIFDLIIVALVIMSVALGFARGFCKEVFTIFGWVAAIIATIYFAPVLFDTGAQYIKNPFFAKLATSATIFLVTLGACSIVSYFATKTLHTTKLSLIDRVFGFIFGVVRAIVLLGLAYTLFSFVYKAENAPDFVKEARTKPFLEASANWLQTILPVESALDTPQRKDETTNEKGDIAQPDTSNEIISKDDQTDTLKQTPAPALEEKKSHE